MSALTLALVFGALVGLAVLAGGSALTGALGAWIFLHSRQQRKQKDERHAAEQAELKAELQKLNAKLAKLSQSQKQVAETVRLQERHGVGNAILLNTQALRLLLDSTNQLSSRAVVEALKQSGVLETLKVLLKTGMLE